MDLTIKLIVGLGNASKEYLATRHNVGFWFVDQLALIYKAKLSLNNKFYAEVGSFKFNNQEILLLKPTTFMNLSGKAVQAIASFYKINPNEILVIHDDLDFSCGEVRLKYSGGNGGHNGLRDIDRVIGRDYWRLRIGINRPAHSSMVVSYVLKPPLSSEKEMILTAINQALIHFDLLLENKINQITKLLHTKAL